MPEEQRQGYIDLAGKLDAHIQRFDDFVESLHRKEAEVAEGGFVLPNGKTVSQQIAETEQLEKGQQALEHQLKHVVEVIAGTEIKDPLTGELSYEGGMRQSLGATQRAVEILEYKASNGGVNAKVKFTFWQKVLLAAVPFGTAGLFALLQAWIQKG